MNRTRRFDAPLAHVRAAIAKGGWRSSFVGLALALAVSPVGARQAPVPAPPASADQAALEKAALEKAELAKRLKADFDRYAFELRTAVAAFQAELQGLQQKGVPREKWPPHPNLVHYPRFEELAMQDQPEALRWCLSALGQIGITAMEVAEKKAEIYARLVVHHPDLPWMADLAHWIQADGQANGIGFERADPLLSTLVETTTVKEVRVAAMSARVKLLETRIDAASKAEQLRLLRELAAKHADTPAGASAKGRIFQAENLVPGKTPPEVEAVDTEGKQVRLADYRGKVLVLDFWGFWCGPCVQGLPDLRELLRIHADQPFAVLGIATDPNLEDFRRRASAASVTWRNAWAGSTQGTWPTAWGVQRYPTVYVLDAKGVVRFVDVRGEALTRAVQTLLDEMRVPSPGPAPR